MKLNQQIFAVREKELIDRKIDYIKEVEVARGPCFMKPEEKVRKFTNARCLSAKQTLLLIK